jgi:hypothetical protein
MSEATNTDIDLIAQEQLDEYIANEIREWGKRLGLSDEEVESVIEQERDEAVPFAAFENEEVGEDDIETRDAEPPQYSGVELGEGTQFEQAGGKSEYEGVE